MPARFTTLFAVACSLLGALAACDSAPREPVKTEAPTKPVEAKPPTDSGTGPIRVGDVYTLLPFDNTMVTLEMTGADVERLCRESVGRRGRGGFGQVSGLSFEVTAEGPRRIRVGGLPLDPKKRYRLVTNSFTAAGGDGYGAISKSTARQDTDLTVREAVMTGLRQLKTVSPRIEGRIRFVN